MHCSSNKCSGSHVAVRCPCPAEGNPRVDSFEKIVNCFWQNQQGLAVERDYYQGLEGMVIAIEESVQALEDENLGYDQPDRISGDVLGEVRDLLLGAADALISCSDFDAIYCIIERLVGEKAGVTPGLVYMTAWRIGLHLDVAPQRIYLQAGARKGASALVSLEPSQRTLDRNRLPAIFQHPELTIEDVQACLEICSGQLSWLAYCKSKE